jgi:predicted DNA-binding protein
MPNNRLYADEETVRFNFWMLKTHYGELQELAKHEGKSVAALVRELITKFLRDEDDGAGPTSRRKQ